MKNVCRHSYVTNQIAPRRIININIVECSYLSCTITFHLCDDTKEGMKTTIRWSVLETRLITGISLGLEADLTPGYQKGRAVLSWDHAETLILAPHSVSAWERPLNPRKGENTRFSKRHKLQPNSTQSLCTLSFQAACFSSERGSGCRRCTECPPFFLFSLLFLSLLCSLSLTVSISATRKTNPSELKLHT